MPWLAACGVAAWQAALVALITSRVFFFIAAALASIALSAAAAAVHADWARANAPIRSIAPPVDARAGSAEPITVDGVLVDDAAVGGEGVTLKIDVRRVRWAAADVALTGVISVAVGGEPDATRARQWRRGRRIRAPVLLRHHARYLNDGVADAERAALRRGIALTGSIKSASLVDVIARGNAFDEWMAAARQRIRDAVHAGAGADPDTASVVTAILIGDRAGLSSAIERRMQRAGTYHVIAISGGNIALFAVIAWTGARLVLRSRRAATAAAIVMVTMYGLLVGAGASVGRAVLAALAFLLATLIDHRAPPLNVMAAVGTAFFLWEPLALTDLGFLLSFGATAGILLVVPRLMERRTIRRGLASLAGLIAATAAAELALLPVQSMAFQRITVAGFVLNAIAIPAMAVVQTAGIALVAAGLLGAAVLQRMAASAAALGARALIDTAALVDAAPFLTWRVAAPPGWLVAIYITPCALLAWNRWPRIRAPACVAAAIAAAGIALSFGQRPPPRGWLALTMVDVGQGEAIALRLPSGRSLLVDAGAVSGRFDAGDRIVVPALLARGVRRLDAFVLTHADVDHAGGALAVITDLGPRRVFEGIGPALNRERVAVMDAARTTAASVESLRAGGSLLIDGVLFRVLHPPPPDWDRQKVRNDDSVVIEMLFGDVSILLTGDVGAAEEPSIAAQLTPSRVRILKTGHHGSRTSSSGALVGAMRPDAALISVGRGNFYGHPAPVVVERLQAAGAEIFRTDRDGEIDVMTDGRTVDVRTWTGRRWRVSAGGAAARRSAARSNE